MGGLRSFFFLFFGGDEECFQYVDEWPTIRH
eukprot:COSAG02_NODE_54_length_43941_cov_54.857990_30_plen_31_part_00